jgi:carboxypeptidase Taq
MNSMEKETTESRELRELKHTDREIQLLAHSAALLQWDQETGMPSGALDERSEQLALLEGLIHDRLASPRVGDLLKTALERAGLLNSLRPSGQDLPSGKGSREGRSSSSAPKGPQYPPADGGASLSLYTEIEVDEASPDFHERAFLRAFGRAWERAVKLPRRWVTEMARASSQAQSAWVDARKKDNFADFRPHLEKLLSFVREKAEILGYPEHPYDALIDEYEPGMRTGEVERVFRELQGSLTPLMAEIASKDLADDSFRYRNYPEEKQREFSLRVLREMGYDFNRGRLDESAHPFTTTLGGSDIRLTTHYNRQDLFTALFGTIHEGGHALYEMGIDPRYHCSVLGEGSSLGIHESQSRTWENLIGRSPEFWSYYFPILKNEYFPRQLEDIREEQFVRGVNRVEPSLIRINADEVTYSLHVILRFELEVGLVKGDLRVKDLPGAWNEGMRRHLGIVPENDAKGVLQDVHWSMGAIGYFPTYALGNLFGAQFFAAMKKDIPDLDRQIAGGELKTIREWQREKIHRYGSSLTAGELCGKISGEALNPSYFVRYLEKKFGDLNVL